MSDAPANDLKQIRDLALAGVTDREICEYLGLTENQLQSDYAAVLIQARAERHVWLRKKQTTVAIEGSAGLLTHLGKHELGQSDKAAAAAPGTPEPRLDYKMG